MAFVIAHIETNDAAVIIAALTAISAILAPVVIALTTSLKRIRSAAEMAVHNTQPNGIPDEEGNVGPPSPFDRILASHEYMIGQLHAVAAEARSATKEATLARAAVKANDVTTAALGAKVESGFAAAKAEREALGARLDVNIANGATFAEEAVSFALDIASRLDALDGQSTRDTLRLQIAESTRPEDEQR